MAKAKLTPYEKHDLEVMKAHTGSIFQRMNDRTPVPIETISTGSLIFDILTGVGGFPRRYYSEMWGLPKVGKTTTALTGLAQVSRYGKGHYIDVELKVPQEYFDSIILANGGNLNNAVLVRPLNGAHAVTILEDYIGWDTAIYVDSVAAIFPPKMLNPSDPAQVFMGSQAKFIGDAIGRARFPLGRSGLGHDDLPTGTAVVLINQVRADFKAPPNSDRLKAFGGYGQGHGIAMSFKMGKGTVNDKRTGATVSCWVTSNQLAAPKARGDTDIKFGMGIDLGLDTLSAGVKVGLIEIRGSYYYLNGDLLDQGKPRAGKALLAMGWDDLYNFRDKIRDVIIAGKEKEPDEPIQAAE